MFSAKVLADSVNIVGNRLTTFELTYPRIIHAEVMTHRMFSRNAASSRAIPLSLMISNVTSDPFFPEHWGAHQSGMQADFEISPEAQELARLAIADHLESALNLVQQLKDLGLHKQVGNRYLEPWMYITVILSTTSIKHFKNLRVDAAAEPHFQKIARMMCEVQEASTPTLLMPGEWHTPLIGFPGDSDFNIGDQVKLSAARCARVSYLTHDGLRDVEADFKLHDRLSGNGHWSPFEHPAQAQDNDEWCGNFQGFKQYRKFFNHEFIEDPRLKTQYPTGGELD